MKDRVSSDSSVRTGVRVVGVVVVGRGRCWLGKVAPCACARPHRRCTGGRTAHRPGACAVADPGREAGAAPHAHSATDPNAAIRGARHYYDVHQLLVRPEIVAGLHETGIAILARDVCTYSRAADMPADDDRPNDGFAASPALSDGPHTVAAHAEYDERVRPVLLWPGADAPTSEGCVDHRFISIRWSNESRRGPRRHPTPGTRHKPWSWRHRQIVAVESDASRLLTLGMALDAAFRRHQRQLKQRRALLVGGAATAFGWPLLSSLRTSQTERPSTLEPADVTTPPEPRVPSTQARSTPPSVAPPPVDTRAAPPVGEVPTPTSPLVLVDHHRWLPAGWSPPDLVVPAVPFNFAGDHEKRHLRRGAASALERLVTAAALEGLSIVGVSGYRSENTQADLWHRAVRRVGEAQASRTNARPGHSEHQTGLAIDVVDEGGSCLLEECFAATPTGAWLAVNAHRFGYLIRYPAGAETITGYRHEPWHLRFVGPTATEIVTRDLTLDEYLGAE